MKKVGKIALCCLLAIVLVLGGYVAYVFLDYHRLGDMDLTAENNSKSETLAAVQVDTPYTVLCYNVGFGAYESDFSFFMDGGTESWAWSEERLNKNLIEIGELLQKSDSDFYFLQEVDQDATRSYHVDEVAFLNGYLGDRATIWAKNYDSPFLFYPFHQPHGASVSGITTASRYTLHGGRRVEVPIEDSLMKLLDLDRCYSVCRVAVEGGGELVLYNLHLSAYTSDGTIAEEQLKLLLADMQREYDAGNWCVAGGDFNKDLLGNSAEVFGVPAGEYTWGQPIPVSMFEGHNLRVVAPLDEANPVPSCRNADAPYHAQQYVLTVDGFMVSDNVAVQQATVMDTEFAYSDHNPVHMTFCLEK